MYAVTLEGTPNTISEASASADSPSRVIAIVRIPFARA